MAWENPCAGRVLGAGDVLVVGRYDGIFKGDEVHAGIWEETFSTALHRKHNGEEGSCKAGNIEMNVYTDNKAGGGA